MSTPINSSAYVRDIVWNSQASEIVDQLVSVTAKINAKTLMSIEPGDSLGGLVAKVIQAAKNHLNILQGEKVYSFPQEPQPMHALQGWYDTLRSRIKELEVAHFDFSSRVIDKWIDDVLT